MSVQAQLVVRDNGVDRPLDVEDFGTDRIIAALTQMALDGGNAESPDNQIDGGTA